jgi:hypothetical protein
MILLSRIHMSFRQLIFTWFEILLICNARIKKRRVITNGSEVGVRELDYRRRPPPNRLVNVLNGLALPVGLSAPLSGAMRPLNCELKKLFGSLGASVASVGTV